MKLYLEETAPNSYGQVMEFKLGNGKILKIHDIDLEDDGQTWFEEVEK